MPITTNTTTLLRALKGAPLACLFALSLCEKPASQAWLRQATGYSPNTVSAALRLLEEMGLARRHGSLGDWSLAGEWPPEKQSAQSGLASMLSAALSVEGTQNAISAPTRSNFEASPGGGEESCLSIQDIPPPPEGEAQLEVSVERVLAATRELFGERVHRPPSHCRDTQLVLATIAEIYTQRHRLNMPARVVYYRLKNQIAPDPAYLHDPRAYLPPSFLAAIGLRLPPEPLPEGPEDQEAELQAAGEAEEYPAHPSLALPTGRGGKITIAQAWETARETLRAELPWHVYQRRVEDVRLVRYNTDLHEFTLSAADAQTAAWLTERLAKRLSRVLSGICDQAVGVAFKVRDEKPDTESTE